MVRNDKLCGWINSIPLRNNIRTINKDEVSDYLIVGAGYTGLSAARKLAELHSNKKIIIVDAQLAGEGASSRNSGYLVDTILNDGFTNNKKLENYKKGKNLNLVISKSGNTLETIFNSNIFIKKNDKNIFITENTNNYLFNLGKKLKAEIIEHKNYIGGRYSVLSEVGMLPAQLMGLSEKKFKQFDNLIKNKKFINSLICNVESTLYFLKRDKFASIILNYDEGSESIFKWYQQLVAESLEKNLKDYCPLYHQCPRIIIA